MSGFRVLQRVLRRTVVEDGGCWVWSGATNRDGYGRVRVGGRRSVLVHRAVYEAVVGRVPEGRELHHVCEIPACVRPSHLVPVSRSEHQRAHRRFATCARCGESEWHETPDGRRYCRPCRARIDRERRVRS